LQRRCRRNHCAPKADCSRNKIAPIESYNCAGAAVDCRLQNHVVIRIGQRWPPAEGKANRPRNRCQVIENMPDVGSAQPTSCQMFRPRKNRFILEHQWDRQQQFKLPVQGGQQKLARSAPVTAQRRNHHVGVGNERSHNCNDIACNITGQVERDVPDLSSGCMAKRDKRLSPEILSIGKTHPARLNSLHLNEK